MNKRDLYSVKSNTLIAKDVYEMVLEGDTSFIRAPGQFINIEIDGLYLRRPISICEYGDSFIRIVYKVVGKGTEKLSQMSEGSKLDVLTGLGNGFNVGPAGDKPLLMGGGVGTPPMYQLCISLLKKGKIPIVVLGFNSKEDVFYEDKFKALGVNPIITTVDGSYGIKGFVTDAIKDLKDYTYYYACGPIPMLKAVHTSIECSGQLSFEERMGCGFGACMGCSIQTKKGARRVCKEGPVFYKEDILW